jgi:hypothetical protein
MYTDDYRPSGPGGVEADPLVTWFRGQQHIRGKQLHDGPTARHLSDLGRAQSLFGVAARLWDNWQPPPFVVNGTHMPALVRKWQDGLANRLESRRAADWYADYKAWTRQLTANGRHRNSAELDLLDRYEEALAGDTGPRFINEFGTGKPDPRAGWIIGPFRDDDEIWGRSHDDQNYIRIAHVDYEAFLFAGIKPGWVGAEAVAKGSAGALTASHRGWRVNALNGRVDAAGRAGLGPRGPELYGKAAFEGELFEVEKDVAWNVLWWKVKLGVEVGRDVEASVEGGLTWKDGRLVFERPDVDVQKLRGSSPVDISFSIEPDLSTIPVDRPVVPGGGNAGASF